MPGCCRSMRRARSFSAGPAGSVTRRWRSARRCDRVLAADVVALNSVPGFDNSAMDGFAVRSGPAGRRLAIVGESRAGAPSAATVGPGEAIRISTGAMLPKGADAVVQVERVRRPTTTS